MAGGQLGGEVHDLRREGDSRLVVVEEDDPEYLFSHDQRNAQDRAHAKAALHLGKAARVGLAVIDGDRLALRRRRRS